MNIKVDEESKEDKKGKKIEAIDIVNKAMKNNFDEAVSTTSSYDAIYMKIVDSKIDSVVYKNDNSGSLFVSHEKKIFESDIPTLEEHVIDANIDKIKFLMTSLKPKKDYKGIAPGPFKYKPSKHFDKKLEELDIEGLSDIALELINTALENGGSKISGMLILKNNRYSLATSKNVDVSDKSNSLRISLRVFNDYTSYQEVTASTSLNDINPKKFSKHVTDVISDVKEYGQIRNGKYDIIYMPAPAANLLGYVNLSACVGNIENGDSFLTLKEIGSEVASKNLTIYDDGNVENAIMSSSFDDEGYPTGRHAVIDRGIFKTKLHNYSTAMKYHTESTGNGGLINPEPKTLVVEHKKVLNSIDDLIKQVGRGILITNVWYTRFSSYLRGEFSTMPRDFAVYIENGEKKFIIKQKNIREIVGIRIHENMMRMLNNIEYVANDRIQASSWDAGTYAFVPSILVREVDVSTI
ncbi:MAG: metallopeptidase TldD-related protein [Candidatus Micrarchaeia archaeon]